MTTVLLALLSFMPAEPAARPAGEEPVRQLVQALAQAWNDKDAATWASLHTGDAATLEAEMKAVFASKVYRNSRRSAVVDKVTFVRPDVAVARGWLTSEGHLDAGGTPSGKPVRVWFLVVGTQEGKRWIVADDAIGPGLPLAE
jgi:uncharacterized protein (TIGR02246 family)